MRLSDVKYKAWLDIPCSSDLELDLFDNVFLIKGFNQDNLYLGRINDGRFFIVINDIYPPRSSIYNLYKNFHFYYDDSRTFYSVNSGVQIKKFLLICFSLEDLDYYVLFDALEDYCRRKDSTLFFESDLRMFLNRLSDIVRKNRTEYSEILGCWGELYFMLFLLDNGYYGVEEILNSWESPSNRMLHDFTFRSQNKIFEVKTTSANSGRCHEFFSLDQLNLVDDFTCCLISLKVRFDNEFGITCLNLVDKIKQYFNNDTLLESKFEALAIVRGKLLVYNSNLRFYALENNSFKFILFENVPRPDITNYIVDVNWVSNCEDVATILESNLFSKAQS